MLTRRPRWLLIRSTIGATLAQVLLVAAAAAASGGGDFPFR
jgi:hypothetical protein